jgi:hypothetical protein
MPTHVTMDRTSICAVRPSNTLLACVGSRQSALECQLADSLDLICPITDVYTE